MSVIAEKQAHTPSACDAPRRKYTPEELESMETQDLLLLYKQTGDQELKWALVLRYEGLIRSVALQIRGVYSSFAQVEDIINEGVITVMGALDKYDPEKGVRFETYVIKRLRGMIIDLARRQDWLPRSIRRRGREIDQAAGELYDLLGRFPTDEEIAQRLEITPERYQEDTAQLALSNVMSLEMLIEERELGADGLAPAIPVQGEQPEYALQERELHRTLAAGIRSLRDNEQTVLALYYQKSLNMKEIAQVMGISEPRVSQIHAKALQRLRLYMGKYFSDE